MFRVCVNPCPEFDDLKQGLAYLNLGDYDPKANEVEQMKCLVPKKCQPGFAPWACNQVQKWVSEASPVPPGFQFTRRKYVPNPGMRRAVGYNLLVKDGFEYSQCLMPWVIYSLQPDCEIERLPWFKTPRAVKPSISKRRHTKRHK